MKYLLAIFICLQPFTSKADIPYLYCSDNKDFHIDCTGGPLGHKYVTTATLSFFDSDSPYYDDLTLIRYSVSSGITTTVNGEYCPGVGAPGCFEGTCVSATFRRDSHESETVHRKICGNTVKDGKLEVIDTN